MAVELNSSSLCVIISKHVLMTIADVNFINRLLSTALEIQLIEHLGYILLLATGLQLQLIDYGQAPSPCIQIVSCWHDSRYSVSSNTIIPSQNRSQPNQEMQLVLEVLVVSNSLP